MSAPGRAAFVCFAALVVPAFAGVPTAAIGPAAVSPSGLFRPYVLVPTGSWPEAVVIGDLNGDGRNDVALVTTIFASDPLRDHKLHVFLQDDLGRLQPPARYAVGISPRSLDIGDLNGDGRNDVVVANFNTETLGVFTQNASGALDPMVSYPALRNTHRVRVGDFNHDGRLDVVSTGIGTNTASLLLQNAGGTLDAAVGQPVIYANGDLEVGDVNDDGLTDVVVMSGALRIDNLGILRQQATGGLGPATYHDLGDDRLTNAVAVGDVNGDAREDVVVTYDGGGPPFIGVFAQDGVGGLGAVQPSPAYNNPDTVETADVNGDGRPDVLVLHGGYMRMSTYLQQPDGTLSPYALDPIPYASHYNPHGMAVGDIDSDGYADVVIADSGGRLVVLYHRRPHELGLTMTDSPDPVAVGSNVTYTITAKNLGLAPMTGVTITDTLPPGMAFVGSTPGAPACTAVSRVVTCPVGTLAPDATATVTVVGRVDPPRRKERTWVNVAHVAANEPETDWTDNTAATSTRYVVTCTYPVAGGGFENGSPNPFWAESSTNFGTPLCTFGRCGNGGGTAGPRSGAWWAWFGGVPALEAAIVSQPVVLREGVARLRFHLWTGAASGNGTDYFAVMMDGQLLLRVTEGDKRYRNGYAPVELDLSRFADGGSHLLWLGSQITGQPGVTNFSLDDVVIESAPRTRPRGSPLVCP